MLEELSKINVQEIDELLDKLIFDRKWNIRVLVSKWECPALERRELYILETMKKELVSYARI